MERASIQAVQDYLPEGTPRSASRWHPSARNRNHHCAMPLGIAVHENIMVTATVAIGAFVFRPRQLISYDRLRSQPA